MNKPANCPAGWTQAYRCLEGAGRDFRGSLIQTTPRVVAGYMCELLGVLKRGFNA